jgi:hypothetical protein
MTTEAKRPAWGRPRCRFVFRFVLLGAVYWGTVDSCEACRQRGGSGRQHDLATVVLLVVEHAVAVGGLIQRHAVADDRLGRLSSSASGMEWLR